MRTIAFMLLLAVMAGCASGGAPTMNWTIDKVVVVDGQLYDFDARLKVYGKFLTDAGVSTLRAVALAKRLEGQPTDQAVDQALTAVVGSTVPSQAAASFSLAARVAKAAIAAGKGGS